MLVQVNDYKSSWIWIIKHIFLINEETLLNILDTFLCKIMKRKMKCIFELCAAIWQEFGQPKISPLYHCHTQLNVCEKEGLQCFSYLIQIFGYTTINLISTAVSRLMRPSAKVLLKVIIWKIYLLKIFRV